MKSYSLEAQSALRNKDSVNTKNIASAQKSAISQSGLAVTLNDVSVNSINFSAVLFDIYLTVDNQNSRDLTINSIDYRVAIRDALIEGTLNQKETFKLGEKRDVKIVVTLPHSSSSAVVLSLLAAKSRSVPYLISGKANLEGFPEPIYYDHEGIYIISGES